MDNFLNVRQGRYNLDLEAVALEAVKVKIQEIFDEIIISTSMEGRDIVIRISLPDEIMKNKEIDKEVTDRTNLQFMPKSNLDKEAQAAADELLGTNQGDL